MKSILVVEDNITISLLYEKILESAGYHIIRAHNGMEAVEKFRLLQVKPDIILMDHRMPVKNGIEASKEIMAINKNSKIIFLSGDPKVQKEALSIGAVHFLEKPFSIKTLIRIIKEKLEFSNYIEAA